MSALSGPAPVPAVDPDVVVDVKRAFLCLFDQEGWARTALMGSLFMLVPFVGPIALQGYMVRVFKHVIVTGDDTRLPPVEDFGDLLGLGVMPFVLAMLWSLPFIFVVYAAMAVVVVVVALIAGGTAAVLYSLGVEGGIVSLAALVVAVVSGTLGGVSMYTLLLLLAYPLQAINTFVELTGRIDHAWNFDLIRRYLRVLSAEYRRAFIGLMAGNLVMVLLVVLVTVLTLGLGYLPALMLMSVIAGMSAAHMRAQLYRLYLARGGEPLPMDERR
jgi:hypothetical protein